MAFTIAAAKAAADNVAKTVRDIEAAAVTLEANRLALVVRIQAWTDADWESGPLAGAATMVNEIAALRNKCKAVVKSFSDQAWTAVQQTFSDWFGDNKAVGDRLPPEFAQLVRGSAGYIDPLHVWPPFETDMAEIVHPGAAGNQTIEADPIDTTLYGGGVIKSKVKTATLTTSAGGNLTVVVNGLQYNGDLWQATITITSGSVVGTKDVAVPAIADTFCKKITSFVITCVGAETWTAGDLDILTDDDRSPAA
jgi:hypothetical protein